MIWALALLLISSAAGICLTYLFDDCGPVAWRLCTGPVIGLAGLSLAGFILASFLGLTPLALAITGALSAAALLILTRPPIRQAASSDLAVLIKASRGAVANPGRNLIVYSLICLLTCLMLWLLFDRAFFYKEDGLYTGLSNNYGDLPFHLSVISRFAYGGNLPPEDPTFAGARFTYPFLADFLAAMFVRAGLGFRGAMLMMNVPLGIALTGLLHRFALELTRDRVAAVLSVLLVLLSGGLGWLLIFPEARQTELGILGLIKHLPHDYTTFGASYRWGNLLTSLLIPQRSILLGMPLAIAIFIIWWRQFASTGQDQARSGKLLPERSIRPMVGAGILAGLLPLIHTHTFAVVIAMGGSLALLSRRWRPWLAFLVMALIIGAPQLLWAMQGSAVRPKRFFEWHPGWDNEHGSVFWFWLRNTGVFIPLMIGSVLWRGKRPLVPGKLTIFYLPFTLCFIVPNLFKLSPWIWDNIKFLIYWYVVAAPLVALLLARLWRGIPLWSGIPMMRAAFIFLFASLVLAGGFDVWRSISRASELRVFDRDTIAFAATLQSATPAESLVLNAPTFNSPASLAGRRSLMEYPGHVWTHGIDYTGRFEDIKQIYAGASVAEDLMARFGVDYVIVSPLERGVMPVSDQFFERFPKVIDAGEYRLYKIKDVSGQ